MFILIHRAINDCNSTKLRPDIEEWDEILIDSSLIEVAKSHSNGCYSLHVKEYPIPWQIQESPKEVQRLLQGETK